VLGSLFGAELASERHVVVTQHTCRHAGRNQNVVDGIKRLGKTRVFFTTMFPSLRPLSCASSAAFLFLICNFCSLAHATDESLLLPLARAPRKSISLKEAVDLALRTHPSGEQARANVDVASARVEESRAPYLPQVAASAQYQRTTGNVVVRPGYNTSNAGQAAANTPVATWDPTFNAYTFGASASQLIYDFGQTSERWRSSEANVASAVDSERATQIQIVSNVRKAYFQARAQKDLVAVASDAVKNQQRHLDQIDGLVAQGMRPEIDRVTAQTNVANAQVQFIAAQNAFVLACAALDQSIGLSASAGYQPADDDMGPVPDEDAPIERLLEIALRDRPELAAFAEQRKAQEHLVGAARGAYGPSLSAQASVSEQGIALDHLTPNWWVGALLSWQIFQGGATAGQVHEAKATLRVIQAQEDAFRLGVRIDVEQSSLAVQAARATLAAAGFALTNARRQLELAESRYTVGMGSVIELGDSQVVSTQTAAQEVNARYTLASARAALLGALGRQ
jgi:outer membrane protein